MTGTFVPRADLRPGIAYILTLGPVTDPAGNAPPPRGSWVLTPLHPSSVTLTASPPLVALGGSSRLEGIVEGASASTELSLTATPAGGAPIDLGWVTTADGRFALEVRPGSNTTYRVSYPGTVEIAPSAAERRVVVRRGIGLVGRSPSVVARGTVGRGIELLVQVSPVAPRAGLSFRLYRFDPAARAYRYAGSFGRNTDAAGRARLLWIPFRAGVYAWRVWVGPSPEFANNVTPLYRWSIR
jgi:hypothetical protein